MIVVDASVGVKWFLEEHDSEIASAIFDANVSRIHVPDLFMVEVSGALVRQTNMLKTKQLVIRNALSRLTAMFSTGDLVPVRSLPADVSRATDIAIDLGHPLKDCIYLALAIDRNCPLMTCDAKFAVKARSKHPLVQLLV